MKLRGEIASGRVADRLEQPVVDVCAVLERAGLAIFGSGAGRVTAGARSASVEILHKRLVSSCHQGRSVDHSLRAVGLILGNVSDSGDRIGS